MRAEGLTYRAIADRLNTEGVPTVAGGVKWHPNSVRSVESGSVAGLGARGGGLT